MGQRHWKDYNKQLIARGSITFLIDPKVFKNNCLRKKRKRRGRPMEFCDSLMTVLLMTKIHYRLAYRALEGFVRSIFTLSKQSLKVPTYSLICKRTSSLKSSLPELSSTHSKVVLLDASGIKVHGEGEWKVKIHGRGRPRKWLKIHIAVDVQTQEIVAEATTHSSVGDSTMIHHLLKPLRGPINTVIADGAYDGTLTRKAIKNKGSKALIPPPKNARYKGSHDDRDQAIMWIKGLGNDTLARSLWGKLTGYSKRALVETAFSRIKRLFGSKLFSKTPNRQSLENTLRCLLLNKMRKISLSS